MSVLIFAEHNGEQLHQNTLHAVYAAQKLGEVHVLVAGNNVQNIAEQASKINGVSKVLHADAPHYAECLAEEIAPLMVSLAEHYTQLVQRRVLLVKISCRALPLYWIAHKFQI